MKIVDFLKENKIDSITGEELGKLYEMVRSCEEFAGISVNITTQPFLQTKVSKKPLRCLNYKWDKVKDSNKTFYLFSVILSPVIISEDGTEQRQLIVRGLFEDGEELEVMKDYTAVPYMNKEFVEGKVNVNFEVEFLPISLKEKFSKQFKDKLPIVTKEEIDEFVKQNS